MNDEAPAFAAYWPWRMAIAEDTYRRWETVVSELFGQQKLAIHLGLPSDFELEILKNINFLRDIAQERQRQAEE
jgi:hypothetical protein